MHHIDEAPCWTDWRWQQQHCVATLEELVQAFPGLAARGRLDGLREIFDRRRVSLTPYAVSLIQVDGDQTPLEHDPMWLQLIPEGSAAGPLEYDGHTENWEQPGEMVTSICQHKYDNRVIVRLSNVCHAYCQFCYEALRTLERRSRKAVLRKDAWQATLDYLAGHPEVEEVILSGGEPLMLADARLDALLSSLRRTRPDIIIRLHTRALSFNPFRITPALVSCLARHQVMAVGLHVVHPRELTPAFLESVRALQQAVPLIFANIPLLAGINGDLATLRELCMGLYRHGVTPHYLYQFMPFSPGHSRYATRVSQGVTLLRQLKRHVSNLAVPEFVIPHVTGKHTLSLELGSQATRLTVDDQGHETVDFINWRGESCTFPY
ncbi:KamA family radical SAM protein [Pseudomonas massiliensis]|uniref:KamA family radical SAM protein n=1 Tax=Pseudomonas massiliensis TaxID=522492 RepID=UPI0006933127|nr:radical SAM protein [Pseudomonas massiliensis]